MTSQKQTEANRRNSLLSTGPRTENGKQQSRCNAYRHGLTAETVIVGLEDAAQYSAFETEIVAEYDPQSVVERELTRRLASLLWRLRRSNLIETGLFSIDAEMSQACHGDSRFAHRPVARVPDNFSRWLGASTNSSDRNDPHENRGEGDPGVADGACAISARDHREKQHAITRNFLALADLANQPLERVGRYEASLWRQFVQVLFSLDQAKYHRIAASRGRFTPRLPQW